jgi:hypothetical protein
MKTAALVLLLLSSAASASPIRQSTMGGDLDVDRAPDGVVLRTMGGDIKVGTAHEFVVAKTRGGNIRVRQLHGSVEATTMGGDIDVNVAAAAGDIELRSMGGSVELTLPANFSGTFDVELEQDDDGPDYRIISDFPLQVRESSRNYWLRRDARVLTATGRIGSGTHRVVIRTIGEDVVIRKR